MTTLIFVEPHGPWSLPSSSVALPQFFFTAPECSQCCGKAQPELQLLRGDRDQLFQGRAGCRRVPADKQSSRTFVQHEWMVGKDRLRLAQQSLCVRVAALGHEAFNVGHQRRHFLLFGGSSWLYRSHVHV